MNSNKIPYKLDVPIDPEMGGSLMECLMVIFKFHNMTFSRESLLAGLPIVSGQLSPKGFEKAAGRAGMKSKTAQRSIKNINTSLLPAVLLLDNSQSCVITSIDVEQGTAQIIYPELTDGYEDIKIEDLEAKYTGYVIFARPNIKYESEKARKFSKTNQHWFWGTIKESKSLYKDVIIASLFISLLSVALPLFVMNIYDRVVPNSSISTLWVLATGVLIALFADFFLRALRHFFVELAASRIDVTLSSTLMEKVLGLSMKEKPKSSGSFINNFQSFESVRAFLNSVTLVALVDLPFAMIFIGIILMIDWHLAMPIFAGAIIILIYGAFTQKTIRNLAEESMAISSRKHGLLTETIIALEDVKVFGKESKVQYEWERQTIFLAKVNAKTRLVGTSVNNVSLWIQQTVSVIIIIVGVYMIIDGQITQGSLIAAYLLSSRAMSPISQTAGLIAQFYHASTALDSLNDLMKKESETSRNDQKSSAHKFQGNIEFQQVSFQYDDDSKLILNNMNLSIKAGEHVAILGKNGCGKSTLNKLLLSLYHPTGGLATLDNVDINQYEPSFLRSRIGYVPQDVVLFSGSLRENIWPHGAQINEDRVRKVIEKCGLVSLVNSHPDGINQFIGEKGNLLSGGQRQAVAIARAVMMEPRIFILDEPTSAMDANNEILLKKMLKQEIAGKTLILNTHRASLLDLVDRVVVLEKGGITSSGPKADILKQKATLADNLPGVKK